MLHLLLAVVYGGPALIIVILLGGHTKQELRDGSYQQAAIGAITMISAVAFTLLLLASCWNLSIFE